MIVLVAMFLMVAVPLMIFAFAPNPIDEHNCPRHERGEK